MIELDEISKETAKKLTGKELQKAVEEDLKILNNNNERILIIRLLACGIGIMFLIYIFYKLLF